MCAFCYFGILMGFIAFSPSELDAKGTSATQKELQAPQAVMPGIKV
jgi:hypothetical protein